jgi:hypothetical protein
LLISSIAEQLGNSRSTQQQQQRDRSTAAARDRTIDSREIDRSIRQQQQQQQEQQ